MRSIGNIRRRDDKGGGIGGSPESIGGGRERGASVRLGLGAVGVPSLRAEGPDPVGLGDRSSSGGVATVGSAG